MYTRQVGRDSIINYSNLPYGSYTLRRKGSNSDGKWNATERVLDIHIPVSYTHLDVYKRQVMEFRCQRNLPPF